MVPSRLGYAYLTLTKASTSTLVLVDEAFLVPVGHTSSVCVTAGSGPALRYTTWR